jgi:hypothetical protein
MTERSWRQDLACSQSVIRSPPTRHKLSRWNRKASWRGSRRRRSRQGTSRARDGPVACAAALAGCGKGKDDPLPDDAARAKLRRQARAWLEAEFAAWTKLLGDGTAESKTKVAANLRHWKEDSDLAGIRDEKELAKLPEEERAELKRLSDGVDALLIKVNGPR